MNTYYRLFPLDRADSFAQVDFVLSKSQVEKLESSKTSSSACLILTRVSVFDAGGACAVHRSHFPALKLFCLLSSSHRCTEVVKVSLNSVSAFGPFVPDVTKFLEELRQSSEEDHHLIMFSCLTPAELAEVALSQVCSPCLLGWACAADSETCVLGIC
jgi:hypothetical protein